MGNTRAARIATIIAARRPLGERAAAAGQAIEELLKRLHELDELRQTLLGETTGEVNGRLRELALGHFIERLGEERAAVGRLEARYVRDTLNIGVVGRARQGKSRLLQSLTGLGSAEIPDGDLHHCTGVRSTIRHNADVEPHAEVFFHSEQSFLRETIAPYFRQLELGAAPLSLDEFSRRKLPLPKERGAQGGAQYEHLRRYHEHLAQYSSWLGQREPLRIPTARIREFVAQDDATGQQVYFNHLAVREVRIVCAFPNRDVGRIAMVDMPGLGDTGIGDPARLVRVLGRDVDLVLFVKKPSPGGDDFHDVDTALYDLARESLGELPLTEWSFMVLNRTEATSQQGDNLRNCRALLDRLAPKHIHVARAIVADCSQAEEAQRLVLDALLDYMAEHIAALDARYAATCEERLVTLLRELQAELDKAHRALGAAASADRDFMLFTRLFDELWRELTGGLEAMLRELRRMRDEEDNDFRTQVRSAIAAARNDPAIPTVQEIEALRDMHGSYRIAYDIAMNEVRAHLSQHFLMLDEGLKRSLEQVKSRVAQVLGQRGRMLSLGGGAEALAGHSGTTFLRALHDLIPDDAETGELRRAMAILWSFDLSYRGLVQHRIRRHLDGLTPDTTTLQLSAAPSAQEAVENLTVLHKEAVWQCETALDKLLAEPSEAAYAIVEEFVDRVLRARDIKRQWQIFLNEYRPELWKSEFDQLGESTRIRKAWEGRVKRAREAAEMRALRFVA